MSKQDALINTKDLLTVETKNVYLGSLCSLFNKLETFTSVKQSDDWIDLCLMTTSTDQG